MTLFIVIFAVLIGLPAFADAHRQGEPAGFSKKLVQAAIERTGHEVVYNGSYFSMAYPNGDVPANVGVCTDVVIRSYRQLGIVFPVTRNPADYVAGDLVTWMVSGNLPHIGIVVNLRSEDGLRPLVVHNIGQGPRLEDMLFDYTITGHYRYYGSQ